MTLLRASFVDTFLRCERKAFFSEWGDAPGVSTPSQALGTAVHAELERYLRGGKLNLSIEAGQIALSGVDLLPPRESIVAIERPFVVDFFGHPFHGTPDLVTRDPLTIWDHKTTKSFGWAKTAADLLSNVQACFYAWAAMHLTGASSVRLVWLYYRTTKPYRALRPPTEVTVTESEIAPTVQRILDAANRIRIIRQSTGRNPLALVPSPSECEAFGGCPHIDTCNLSPHERFSAIMTQQANAAEADLLARINAARQSAAPVPATTPAPEPGLPPAQPGHVWAQVPGVGWQQFPVAVSTPVAQTYAPDPKPVAINPPVPSFVPPSARTEAPVMGAMPSGAPVTSLTPDAPKRRPGRPRKEAAPGAPTNDDRETFLAACELIADRLFGGAS